MNLCPRIENLNVSTWAQVILYGEIFLTKLKSV